MNSSGTTFSNFLSTSSTFFPGANWVRLQTRKICVSTAIVGQPKAVFKTTLAVLRPTPGSASRAARSSGTSPWCFSNKMRQVLITFSALVLYNPMVFIYSFRLSTPRLRIVCGVLATGYNFVVALLTLTSVACADSNTDISNSKEELKANSVVGCGLLFCKRVKIAIRFC
ncbi:hypothetical protein XBP1_2830044 [Xenorhabdus bovienii str. puntauvense]|uniref:Uncharacterized protein n=1 Tax=Xenorhabdus bovienii str. puntauvense TaxID=1398201 RepID=A0A077NJ66_XENBV|nr:hypothetical protein XBP1_2830044 [Xenorhabdus bovienii str. puntauvense]